MKKTIIRSVLLLFACFLASYSLAQKAVLLVSLGMPDSALKSYLKQAKSYQVPVVIRGLYTDKQHKYSHPYVGSFQDTAMRLKSLIGKSNLGGVSIDPTLFRAFGIKIVPAFVVYDEQQSCLEKSNQSSYPACPAKTFDVVFGNLSIEKQLYRIVHESKSSDRANFAKYLLDKIKKEGAAYE